LLLTFGAVAVLRVHCKGEEDEPDMEEMPEMPDIDEPDDDMEDMELTSQQVKDMHGKMDTDKNGKVSMEEIMLFSSKMRKTIASRDISAVLDEMDTDKDGKLSLDELMKDMENMEDWDAKDETKESWEGKVDVEKAKFKEADLDGDGFLSKEEVPALFYPETHEGVLEITTKASMKARDANGDGKLTKKEFFEGDTAAGGPVEISKDDEAEFKNLDKNVDGFIDYEELKAYESGIFHTEQNMLHLFDVADTNKDKHVSADELDAAKDQLQGTEAKYHLLEWAEHNEL